MATWSDLDRNPVWTTERRQSRLSSATRLPTDLERTNREFGTTILFVEQNLSVIQGLAERCYAIDHGTIVDEITGEAVEDRQRLEEYLVV
ncbi:hypothetical protein [Halorubrum trueperi]|uniref:ABC transporter ATP-binding protein n=1 Tax=Halorubrum trueperi TaxID=2004704 RepID=A0ABD5UDI9_9EURY